METVILKPEQITVKDRYREDLGDLKSLSESIAKYGNILPIIVNRKHELIDGGRRTAAAALAGKEILCVYNDTVDEDMMKELEIEANLHRKDFTPSEYASAVSDFHARMQVKHGKAQPGASGGWTIEDTAKKAGVSKAKIREELEIAEAIKVFPGLENSKKRTDIKKAIKALGKLTHAVAGVEKYEKILEEKKGKLFELHKADALEFMLTVPDSSVNILLTDPLYGIEHDKLMIGLGGQTGGQSSTGYKFNDATEPALRGYEFLAYESYRFTSADAHAYIFMAHEHFYTIKTFFTNAGWLPYIKPIIWIKRSTGSCNFPTYYPSDCYEVILYCRKQESRLIKEGMPNWIECMPLTQGEKIHQYEKPVKLLDNLLQRSCLPGQTLFDPFMGSASSIEAGVTRKLYSIGCDNSQEAYAFASQRMVNFLEQEEQK